MTKKSVALLTQREVEEAEKLMFAITGTKRSLGETISSWRVLVSRLEWGLLPDPDEFRQTVEARELLEQVRAAASPVLRDWLEVILEPLDLRFVERTKPYEPVWSESEPCWRCRVPLFADKDWTKAVFEITTPEEGTGAMDA